jgi:hypothetical protein
MTFRRIKKIGKLLPVLIPIFFIINYFEDGATLRDSKVLAKDFFMLPDPPFAENLNIGTEWQTLTPDRPIESYFKFHTVHVYSKQIFQVHIEPEYKEYDGTDKTILIHLKDGTTAKFEAILYDDQGTAYPLKMGPIGRKIVEFSKIRTKADVIALREHRQPDFPYERTYTSLKVRCDIPLHIEKIVWATERPMPWIISPIAVFKQLLKESE